MAPAGYDLLGALHVWDTSLSTLYACLVHSSAPWSRYSRFPFLDEDTDLERCSYCSQLTRLVSGRVWVRTDTARWQGPRSSPPHRGQSVYKRNDKSIRELTGRGRHLWSRRRGRCWTWVWVTTGREERKREVGHPQPQDVARGGKNGNVLRTASSQLY